METRGVFEGHQKETLILKNSLVSTNLLSAVSVTTKSVSV